MAGINPISGLGPIGITPSTAPAGKAADKSPASSFTETLRGAIDNVEKSQQSSQGAVQNLLSSGDAQDVLPVVAEVAKADMSFRLLIGVRNKVIEAYKQTMNMQV